MPLTLPQSLVLLPGGRAHLPFHGEVFDVPAPIEVTHSADGLDVRAEVPGRGLLRLVTSSGNPAAVNVSVFREREVFLVTALCSNVHEGWDPSLHGRLPHPECCGPDKRGHAFVHARKMERVLHSCHLPITWMVDATVALQNRADFLAWHQTHGDEIALMPPSRSHFNPVNWNTERTVEDTERMVAAERDALQHALGLPVTSLAIDQFIGSVGSHFAEAAERLGFSALWGMGFDHATCDTSMHHFGCPWDAYRPSRDNFRIPSAEPRPLWVFPWTFRDLVNTVRVPGGMSGAVMFSTDVDDIIACRVAEHQADYYHRLAEGLLANREGNRFLCLLIHQEDHDCWHEQGLDYYDRFFHTLPPGFTPATMAEVAAWLDLTHPYPEQPVQRLRLRDPLACKEAVAWPFPGVERPLDWGPYPPHVFECSVDRQTVTVEGESKPLRVFDYRANHPVAETGIYPTEPLP